MTKNLIPGITKMLDVELGEEFKVVYKTGVVYKGFEIICNFTMAGLFVHKGDSGKYEKELLADIICGKAEIVKFPWKPKYNQPYWTFNLIIGDSRLCVVQDTWIAKIKDVALFKAGWVYRSEKEAQAALPSVAKELGVEYKL